MFVLSISLVADLLPSSLFVVFFIAIANSDKIKHDTPPSVSHPSLASPPLHPAAVRAFCATTLSTHTHTHDNERQLFKSQHHAFAIELVDEFETAAACALVAA